MARHKWHMSWPGNTCVRCGADDPVEQCMGICDLAPPDENGYPDPRKCPEHSKPEYWECLAVPDDNRLNQ